MSITTPPPHHRHRLTPPAFLPRLLLLPPLLLLLPAVILADSDVPDAVDDTTDAGAPIEAMSLAQAALNRQWGPIRQTLRAHAKSGLPVPGLNTPDDDGRTALMYAAASGNGKVARELVAAGADVRQRVASPAPAAGFTPLHYACASGNLDVVRVLVEQSDTAPDLDALSDSEGRTPLMIAAHNGHSEVITYLITAHLEIEHRLGYSVPAVDVERTRSGARETALHIAAAWGHTAAVRALNKYGKADPNALTVQGWTPLMFACQLANDAAQDTVYALLYAGGDPNVVAVDAGKRVVSALHIAAQVAKPAEDDAEEGQEGGKREAEEAQAASDPAAADDEKQDDDGALLSTGVHPVPAVAEEDLPSAPEGPANTEIVRILLQAGANPKLAGGELERTALMIAVQRNDPRMAETIIEYGDGLDVYQKDKLGLTARGLAQVVDNYEMAELLDMRGETTSGWALKKGRNDIKHLLLKNGLVEHFLGITVDAECESVEELKGWDADDMESAGVVDLVQQRVLKAALKAWTGRERGQKTPDQVRRAQGEQTKTAL